MLHFLQVLYWHAFILVNIISFYMYTVVINLKKCPSYSYKKFGILYHFSPPFSFSTLTYLSFLQSSVRFKNKKLEAEMQSRASNLVIWNSFTKFCWQFTNFMKSASVDEITVTVYKFSIFRIIHFFFAFYVSIDY